MRIWKSKSKRIKKLRNAAIKEGISSGISYITGLPFPLGLIETILGKLKGKSPRSYVNWKLENWPEIYYQEVQNCIFIPYKGEKYYLPEVLIFDNTEQELSQENIRFDIHNVFFKIRDEVRSLTEVPFQKLLKYLRRKTNYSNKQNLRLFQFIKEEKEVILHVQPVLYEYFVHTNLLPDVELKEGSLTLRKFVHENGKLEDLENSPFANHLGIGILLFTADGSMILQRRSNKVTGFTGELCPAASGALSFLDVSTGTNFENFPKLREAFEEIGFSKTDIPENPIFLGMTRELIRGGKPELFFMGKTNLSEEQVKKKWKDARDKWEAKKISFFHIGKSVHNRLTDIYDKNSFFCKIDEFIDKFIDHSSLPLLATIALWIKYKMR